MYHSLILSLLLLLQAFKKYIYIKNEGNLNIVKNIQRQHGNVQIMNSSRRGEVDLPVQLFLPGVTQ